MKSPSATAWFYGLLLCGKYAAALPQLIPDISITVGLPVIKTETTTATVTVALTTSTKVITGPCIPTSTADPTTVDPTTVAPTTVDPTTVPPTTVAPTTDVPIITETTVTTVTVPTTVPPTTTTEVTTSSVTVTAPCTATPTGCGNQGLAYVLQTHAYTNNPAPTYASFVVNHFKTAPAVQEGILHNGVGFLNRGDVAPISIYNGTSRNTDFVALNHRGYFVPTASGTYTVACSNYDDILLLWVGPTAFDGAYTRANANMELQFDNAGTSGSYSVAMTAGNYFPFRLLVANAQGPGWRGFTCTIRNPAGSVIVDLANGTGANFVQFACDGKVGAFKPFGQELP